MLDITEQILTYLEEFIWETAADLKIFLSLFDKYYIIEIDIKILKQLSELDYYNREISLAKMTDPFLSNNNNQNSEIIIQD